MKGCFMKKSVSDMSKSIIIGYALQLMNMNPDKYTLLEAVIQVKKALEQLNK
jgi:hypothetical protein